MCAAAYAPTTSCVALGISGPSRRAERCASGPVLALTPSALLTEHVPAHRNVGAGSDVHVCAELYPAALVAACTSCDVSGPSRPAAALGRRCNLASDEQSMPRAPGNPPLSFNKLLRCCERTVSKREARGPLLSSEAVHCWLRRPVRLQVQTAQFGGVSGCQSRECLHRASQITAHGPW